MVGKGKKGPDNFGGTDDATDKFIKTVTTAREIRAPIEVRDTEKERPRTADEYEILYDPETDTDHPLEKFRTNRILRCMCTREIARYLDRRTFITVSVREAFCYVIFLLLLTSITFGATPLDMFYFSQAMSKLYTKQKFQGQFGEQMEFYDICTLSDMIEYGKSLEGKLAHSFWYSKPDASISPEHSEDYFYENKVIGRPQMRQVLVRNDTCTVDSAMKHWGENCYGPYTAGNERKDQLEKHAAPPSKPEEDPRYVLYPEPQPRNFGVIKCKGSYSNLRPPDYKPHVTHALKNWFYTEASESGSMSISGVLATYGGGGYVYLLAPNQIENTFLTAINYHWIQRGSRALFIEFVIYNGNVNLFCIFKLIFELPATGGVIPSHWNFVQKLIRYNDSFDYFILVCEIIFFIYVLVYTVQKILEVVTLRSKLLTSFWSWIDVIILLMCYLVFLFTILLYIVVEAQIPKLVSKENDEKYASFDEMCYIHICYSYSLAILLGFAFFRLLKYLNVVHAMYQLQSTISRAMADILSYCVMFFYVYFVFALFGCFLFGNKIEDYKSFPMSIFALMRSSVGDLNYHKLVQASPFWGPVFFCTFIFFIAFILVNMFLAILVNKYEEVRSEVRIGGARTFVGDMSRYWFLRMLERAECNWLLSQIERRRYEKKARSPTEAIRQYLRQAGYSELEIELFFKKYDITDSKIATMDEDKFTYSKGEREAPPPLSQKDILRYIIIQKLEYLENHYQAANRLIDEFLSKLSKFEPKR